MFVHRFDVEGGALWLKKLLGLKSEYPAFLILSLPGLTSLVHDDMSRGARYRDSFFPTNFLLPTLLPVFRDSKCSGNANKNLKQFARRRKTAAGGGRSKCRS